MRKTGLCFIIYFFAIITCFAQQIVQNSDKLTSKTAGRIVMLEEVLRIKEDGKDIIFSYPYDLQIGPDDGIYFYDNWQLHKFDSEGNFVCKILKFGQGPGEIINRTRYTFWDKKIIVQAGVPPKILTYDLDGKYIDEMKTEIPRAYLHFINLDGKLMGFLPEIDESVIHKEGYFDMPLHLYKVELKANSQTIAYSFPIKHYVKPGMWWQRAVPVFAISGSDSIYIVHTEDYQIREVNLNKRTIERIITRKYDRVKYVPSEELLKRIARYPDAGRPPMREFVQDIRFMTIKDDNLWAITSTSDEEGRTLIDVFDMSGTYIDKFYLEFPDSLATHRFNMSNIAINRDFIFTVDQGIDDFYSIAKYKIVDD